MHILQTQKACW